MAAKKQVIDDFTNGWMQRVKAGIEYRQKYSTYSQWDTFRKYYRGQWADSLVPVNKIYNYGRMLIPRVYFRAPRVSVTAIHPDLVPHAKVVEAIDNMLIRETMLKETLKMSSLDSYLSGVGPIKLGYDSEFGYLPDQAVTDSGETVTQHSRKTGDKIEYRESVKAGMPWALRTRPEDVIVPWGSSDPWALPWICHYVLRPLEDVKQDQKYKNTDQLQGTRTPSMGKDIRVAPYRPRQERDKDVLFAELWEIRDVKSGEIIVFCEDQILMRQIDELQIEGLPWEFIVFNPDPEYFWAIPDCVILEPQQKELNATRTQASRHRAIALLKFLYKRNAIKPEELEKLLSGLVGPGVAIDDDNILNAVQILQPHIPPDLATEAGLITNDMRESMGFSPNQLGQFSPYHGKTATETMTVAESFEVRVDERRDIVADALVRIVRKWNQIIFKHWQEERVIQIVTPEGTPFWVQYTGDQIKGEYLLGVDADSGMPLSRSLKYQMGKEMVELFGGDTLIDQITLRQILLDSYAIVDPRASKLLNVVPGAPVQAIAANRQPFPIKAGGGKGSAGGREGSSPEKPQEFEAFRKRFQMKGKKE